MLLPVELVALSDVVVPGPYSRPAAEVVAALRALPPGARVVSDIPGLVWQAGRITPRLLNTFTVFYNRMNNPNFNQQISHNGAKEWGIANIDSAGYPSVNWGGGPIYGLSNIGNNQDDFQAYNGNGLTDTLSFSHGRHFLKAGIAPDVDCIHTLIHLLAVRV